MELKTTLYGWISWIVFKTSYIFPEFPAIGAFVVGVAALLFVFYLIKQGIGAAFKVSLVLIIASIIAMIAIHSVIRIFQTFIL